MNLRLSDFGAGRPNSNFQRLRRSSWPRSGKRAISASRAASSRSRRDIGSRRPSFTSGLHGSGCPDPIGPDTVDLFGDQWKFQLLAHRAGQEASYRVFLPSGCVDQYIQGCASWLLKQGDNPILFWCLGWAGPMMLWLLSRLAQPPSSNSIAWRGPAVHLTWFLRAYWPLRLHRRYPWLYC